MSQPLQGTASAANAISRVKYTHDALIDAIIANPGVSQGELAKMIGYGQPWVSRVMNSDAFLARLAARKEDVIDPALTLTFEERIRGAAAQSLEILQDKLAKAPSFQDAVKVFEITTRAAGYGASKQNVAVQHNYVVALPAKATSSEEWAKEARSIGAEAGATELSLVERVDPDDQSV